MKYSYIAKNNKGEKRKGEMEVADRREVTENLRKEGFWPLAIDEIENKKKDKDSWLDRIFTVPLKNKTIFCRHLAVMINSGLPLSRALSILAKQERNSGLRKVTHKMADDVRKGVSFADAMGKYPNVFNKVFVSLVRMGELSGKLEDVLVILADQLEKDHKLISKVRGAMIYPAIIVTAMLGIGGLMMIFVIPKVVGIFEEFGTELPLATRILIATSNFMSSNAWLTLGGVIAAVVSIRTFYKTSVGTKFFHMIFLKLPIFGMIITKVNSARFSRILSSLLDSGISLVESLRITADTLGNYYFKTATLEASEEVQKGIALPEILREYENIFPYLVVQMAGVGEETGQTPEVLKKLAQFYEEEVDQITQNLSSIIEPVLMLLIGGAVGVFAVSIIQPIYSVMGGI